LYYRKAGIVSNPDIGFVKKKAKDSKSEEKINKSEIKN
jgi:hypothetical protein